MNKVKRINVEKLSKKSRLVHYSAICSIICSKELRWKYGDDWSLAIHEVLGNAECPDFSALSSLITRHERETCHFKS